jgi:hypothetical protein
VGFERFDEPTVKANCELTVATGQLLATAGQPAYYPQQISVSTLNHS